MTKIKKEYLNKIEGHLETYWETGYEDSMAIQVYDHRGPKFDPKAGEFQDLDWGLFLNKTNVFFAEIKDREGDVVYDGPLTHSRKLAAQMKEKSGFWLPFVPEEISLKDWAKFLREEYPIAVWSNDLPYALYRENNIKFRLYHKVFDDLTQKPGTILGIQLSDHPVDSLNKVRYLVDNDHVDGVRFAWEISELKDTPNE